MLILLYLFLTKVAFLIIKKSRMKSILKGTIVKFHPLIRMAAINHFDVILEALIDVKTHKTAV